MVHHRAGRGGKDVEPDRRHDQDDRRQRLGALHVRQGARAARVERLSVAFLGLGAIGRPMAARVAARHPLVVWNRTAGRAQEFARQTACRVAGSPAEAVREADVVVTCLSTSLDVESLLDGPDGLLAGLRPGTLFLDCTSGDPAGSNRIARRLAERGVAFADCPVSGGTNGAEAGTLTVMVGGDPAVFERARPYLECFGKLIV
ncbi:MAG: NAD(P)-dependent oxidoreductase, partial [Gemmatimonadales bacterium]|nr:NAD(P)-dependent oxidoreductase [Gemmatimonadales bacterium]